MRGTALLQTLECSPHIRIVYTSLALVQPGDGYAPQFSYHEIRYVTISPLSSPPALSSVVGQRLFTARARVGTFSSSIERLNSMFEIFARNYEGLTLSGYTVDCPHRERMGYGAALLTFSEGDDSEYIPRDPFTGGDGHTSMEFAMATYASSAFFTKWAADWVSVQGYDGTNDLPNTVSFPLQTCDFGGFLPIVAYFM
jgi:hypothetical protein